MRSDPAERAAMGERGRERARRDFDGARNLERMLDVVERVPLHVGLTAQNAGYLATKALKSGHLS